MRPYTQITFWENARRRKVLADFRADVVLYFTNSESHWQVEERIENPKAKEARDRLNRMLQEAGNIVFKAGIPSSVQYTPPPMIGGYIQNLDVLINIFDLHQYEIPSNRVTDIIDRALGVYERDWRAARLRTFNPFWWLGRAMFWFARLPYYSLAQSASTRRKLKRRRGAAC